MRIFFAVPRSAWVDINLRQSLEDMGHQLVRFEFPGWPDDADPLWRTAGKPMTNQRLLDAFRVAREGGGADLFFGYLYSSVVYPETIELIRRSGVPTVNFSCNNVHQFDLVRDIAPCFDVCIVPEQAAQADFLSAGARALRIQLAANPRFYRPYPYARTYDVTFVGQRYADRAELLALLRQHGLDVRAWGAGWAPRKRADVAHLKAAVALYEDERFDGFQRFTRRWMWPRQPAARSHTAADVDIDTQGWGGPRLLQRDLVRTFSQSRVSLGFATAGSSHLTGRRLTHLRLREFEATMSGALYVTEDQAELAEYFSPGEEVITYADASELVEKTRYYVRHEEEAERIRRAGLRRARREHTWQHRFAQLFAELGLASAA
jgi:glycosyltransferase involved in cell wall biosynthesis